MSDLRKMLDKFKNNYVYPQTDGCSASVRVDNELIYRILSEIMNKIETIELQNRRDEIVEVEPLPLIEAINKLNKYNIDVTFLSEENTEEIEHSIAIEPSFTGTNGCEFFDSVSELIKYAEKYGEE